ncbi:hypothetical protein Pfo_031212, partial [Paulownia fortunei]
MLGKNIVLDRTEATKTLGQKLQTLETLWMDVSKVAGKKVMCRKSLENFKNSNDKNTKEVKVVTDRTRYVPSRAALSIIRPAIGKQQTISDKAKAAMQGYLNHFLGNMDIINSRE